ncbi:glucosidase II [Scheffersomyces amazonensis]|uniref:glucosidase II n=1 Tax=Scheffersomyces amazonensis TaxID=1078765 RepID=UPI00315D869C
MKFIRQFHIILILIWAPTLVFGVKESLFKTCENSGFCHRNKYFAESIKNEGSNYQSRYSIAPESILIESKLNTKIIHGQIIKDIPTLAEDFILPFELSILEGNNIRFTINEEQRHIADIKAINITNYRYNQTSDWAFVTSELPYLAENLFKVEIDQSKSEVIVHYGESNEYKAILTFNPVTLTVFYNDIPQVIANHQNFFNFEHWRPKESNYEHLTVEETDYGMFEDHFVDSENDKIPLGPESIALDFTFKGFKNLYGIPEHADSLNLKDTTDSDQPYRLYNVDIFEYETNSRMAMYGAIPLLLAVKPEISLGLFWINGADTFINVDKTSNEEDSSTHWISENGVLDFMIIIDKTPANINYNYGLITGFTQLPPLFSLGYHQCRWNYNDEKDVLDVNQLMDKHQFPYDTIWLDIEYTDQKKYFTWDKHKFPSPKQLLKSLDHTGRNLVIIIDPHLKTNYFFSDEVIKKQACINDSKNTTFYGHCWPGESVWIDTFNPTSQPIWDSQFEWNNEFFGLDSSNVFLWNDMNEPSVFNGPETSAPKDNIHFGGWEHRSVHNIYGLTYHEATYESLIKRTKGNTNRTRPFILTRSYFAGSQRTAAMWTGDNMSKWEYLKISIPMVLTSNIVNMPFSGADVGGFFGNPSKELLTRWYQAGIWYPFFRAHAHIDARRREPWIAGEPYTSIMRDAVLLRYALLPTLYTAFYESSKTGIPIFKPIFYEALTNPKSYSIDDEFFFGNSGLLVKPVTDEGADRHEIYIPDTEVYYDYTNRSLPSINVYKLDEPGYIKKDISLQDIPALIKGGHIISLKERYRRSTRLMVNDPYTLIIALNNNGVAEGQLYIDDGESFEFENSGELALVKFSATESTINSQILEINDTFKQKISSIKIEKIIILNSKSNKSIESISIKQGDEEWQAKFDGTVDKKTIIHNAKIKVSESWDIQLIYEPDHDEL